MRDTYVVRAGIVVPGPGERVSVVAAWVNQILQDRRREGGLRVHPAIVSRVFGALSGGLLGYEQARWDIIREQSLLCTSFVQNEMK